MHSPSNQRILITGGAGFIGSHLVRLMATKYSDYHIYNLDKLTYAGNLENLKDIENAPNYHFIKGDINDADFVAALFQSHDFHGVIHLAAESHVDRSITGPMECIRTNVIGTANLLNAARAAWNPYTEDRRFYHISTDEVYGSLGKNGYFTESSPYDPKSPYSASKAGSDHLVRAFSHTYGLPVVISNCSNNYGPNQFPEKLIPLCINNIRLKQPIPIYGKGDNVRDWLHVADHAEAIDLLYHRGIPGETYNIGGNNEWKNIELIKLVCSIMDQKLHRAEGTSSKLITFVKDRAGHDLRYAIDASKIKNELGWEPRRTFETGLSDTVDWYLNNQDWLQRVTSGTYMHYYQGQYENR